MFHTCAIRFNMTLKNFVNFFGTKQSKDIHIIYKFQMPIVSKRSVPMSESLI